MKRKVIFEIAVVGLALCGCGRARPAQQQTVATTAGDTAEAMTVVGCLVPAGERPENRVVGTSGNPPPPSFMLVNVTTTCERCRGI